MALLDSTTRTTGTGASAIFLLYALNVQETSGTATAQFQIKDDTSGNIIGQYNLAPNETVELTWDNPLRALRTGAGIQIVQASGAIGWSARGKREPGMGVA